MQVSCQAWTREGCASFHLPPNSLELFTLFSLPFLHFYNFSGTQVEWVGGRSPVLPGPHRAVRAPRSPVATRLLFHLLQLLLPGLRTSQVSPPSSGLLQRQREDESLLPSGTGSQ